MSAAIRDNVTSWDNATTAGANVGPTGLPRLLPATGQPMELAEHQIGRASCRERV